MYIYYSSRIKQNERMRVFVHSVRNYQRYSRYTLENVLTNACLCFLIHRAVLQERARARADLLMDFSFGLPFLFSRCVVVARDENENQKKKVTMEDCSVQRLSYELNTRWMPTCRRHLLRRSRYLLSPCVPFQ